MIGQLEYVPGQDCFVLDGFGDDTARTALAWPPGTTARMTAGIAVVAVPGFGDVQVNDWLRGGGYYERPDRGQPEMPSECSPSAVEFVVLYDVTEAGPEPLIEK